MKNFVGIFLALTVLIMSVPSLAEPNKKAYRNANDNASFKDGKNGDYDSLEDRLRDEIDEESRDNDWDKKKDKKNKKGDDSFRDRLDDELNDDDWDKKGGKNKKKKGKK